MKSKKLLSIDSIKKGSLIISQYPEVDLVINIDVSGFNANIHHFVLNFIDKSCEKQTAAAYFYITSECHKLL